MFNKLKSLFSASDIELNSPNNPYPELLGLKLGGSFTIDDMLLKTMEGDLT